MARSASAPPPARSGARRGSRRQATPSRDGPGLARRHLSRDVPPAQRGRRSARGAGRPSPCVRGAIFITDAAATASGEGATRAAKASRVSASPSARRGASWPAGCSSARPPAADGRGPPARRPQPPRCRCRAAGAAPAPDKRARHHQQADLLERRREAQAKRLADRLEGHVGRDAVDHDRGHDGEEDGKVQALDQQHDRDHGDRHEKGGEKHGPRP